MRIWIDNTGLHSAGSCLEERARGLTDVKGLLQFCMFLIFAEQIRINGFEPENVAYKTREIRDWLYSIGVTKNAFSIDPATEEKYASACEQAATELAERLGHIFEPDEREILGLSPLDIPERIEEAQKTLLRLSTTNPSDQELERIRENALEEKAAGATAYMAATSEQLRREISSIVSNTSNWSPKNTRQLNGYLRCYLNHCLAEKARMRYGPAIGRAKLARARHEYVISRLSGKLDQIVNRLRSQRLPVPSVYSALIQKSKGDPQAAIYEALEMREKATPLRSYLSGILDKYDVNTHSGRSSIDKEMENIIDEVRRNLGLKRKKDLFRAIDVSFTWGTPSPKLNGQALLDWFQSRWESGKIEVLTELSETAAFPDDHEPEYFSKFKVNCGLQSSA